MKTVSIPGGLNPEILELIEIVTDNEDGEDGKVFFTIFDVEENTFDQSDNWTYVKCESEAEMVEKAVEAVAKGEADILLKGIVSTNVILKEVLKKEHGLKMRDTLSHVSYASVPGYDRKFLITDAAMNIEPTPEQLEDIVKNAVEISHNMGNAKPKVALLSSAENFNPKMPSSVLAKTVTERFEQEDNVTVFGPISLDLAMSKSAVEHKRFEGPIQGDADILVVPTIDVGNVLYKSLFIFSEATMGGIIVGTKVPIVLTSRSDAVESKLIALELALKQV